MYIYIYIYIYIYVGARRRLASARVAAGEGSPPLRSAGPRRSRAKTILQRQLYYSDIITVDNMYCDKYAIIVIACIIVLYAITMSTRWNISFRSAKSGAEGPEGYPKMI